ncbi:MAG: membrane protein insertion efficiency factor YidD [Acidimicrobiales bacterium]
MARRAVLWLLRQYQGWSSLRTARCRYIPTCSHYAYEAVEVHGLGPGLWLATKRLARCHPFGSYGLDPVPEPASADPDLAHAHQSTDR